MTHIPQRTCICCKNEFDKSKLIRIVRLDGRIFIDETKKSSGRGAYFCASDDCKKKLLKSRALDRAFKQKVPDDVYSKLIEASAAD